MDDKFEKWFDKNETKLIDRYVEEHPDEGILDDDMPDLVNKGYFQDWVEEVWAKEHGLGFEVRLSNNPNFKNYTFKYFKKRPDAQRYARMRKMSENKYYRIIPVDIDTCRCGRLKAHEDIECLRCDKLRMDTQGDW